MNSRRAFLAGMVGAAAMSIILAMARALMVMDVHLEMMLGTMILGAPADSTRFIAGLVMHLIISGMIALIYAVGFEYVSHRAGWLTIRARATG